MGNDSAKMNTTGDTHASFGGVCRHNPSSSTNWIRKAWDYFCRRSDLFDQETDTAMCAGCRAHLQVPEAVWRGRFLGKVVALFSVDAAIIATALYINAVGREPTYSTMFPGMGADVFAVGAPAMLAAILVGCWLAPRVITSLVMALAKWPAVDLQGVKMVDYLAQRRIDTKKRKKEESRRFAVVFCLVNLFLARALS